MTTMIFDSLGREGIEQTGGRCPRRTAGLADLAFPGSDIWERHTNTCGYCGSLHPDAFMARLEAQDVELVPTDKSYKAYVRNTTGAMFVQRYRADNLPEHMRADTSKWVWMNRDVDAVSFYFQHLNQRQRGRFIELLNLGQLRFAYPGHFYTTPFFITYEKESNDGN